MNNKKNSLCTDQRPLSGWLCLDKPEGISSNFAMSKVSRIFGMRTGYVGTLDPFATGVLPIAVGECRKFIPFIEDSRKTYEFTVVFGKTTDTLDKYGKITGTSDKIPSKEEISAVISSFFGKISQIPPLFSAIKVSGRRACDLIRAGKEVELLPRNVEVFSLKIIDRLSDNNLYNEEFFERARKNRRDGHDVFHAHENPRDNLDYVNSGKLQLCTFELVCSKGTYVRSIARDIADKLGSVGYVDELRRTEAGFFSIKTAFTLEKLEKMRDTSGLATVLSDMESPLDDIPALYLNGEQVTRLQNGLRVSLDSSDINSSNVLIFDNFREFKGVGFVNSDGEVMAVRMCIY